MSSKIKVSCVSYLNSKPFIYGFEFFKEIEKYMQLELDIPSICANKLLNNQVDVGLVPVAILNKMKDYQIISNYCIGTLGNVKSVNLYSNVPLEQIEKIQLDFHSQSSITLTKVLCSHFWKKNVEFINASENYIDEIMGTTAGVVIGDRTFFIENKFSYVYDLPLEWKKYTGLPFVFACWVANKKIENNEFLFWFTKALEKGVNERDSVAQKLMQLNEYKGIDVKKYFTENIDYFFDADKKNSLELFLKLSKGL